MNSPGLTITDRLKGVVSAEKVEKYAKETPLRRNTESIDVAKGVVFLSSSDASFITGANLVVDGGQILNLHFD